jgi:signal transduction histidine kinase
LKQYYERFFSRLKLISLSGDYELFSLEHRIFNVFSFYSFVASFCTFLSNSVLGLTWKVQVIVTVCGFVLFLFFYIARFKRKFKHLIIPYNIILVLFLSSIWFFNGGINSPTGYFYFVALFSNMMIISISALPAILIISNVLIIILLEYFYPSLVTPYTDRLSQYLDVGFGFVWTVSLLSLGLYLLKKNYDLERMKVEKQKQELENLNQVQNKLLSIISHDVRAPLNSLQGTLNLLKLGHLSEAEVQLLVEELGREVGNTSSLLNNLLYWSQNQRQGIYAQPTVIQVADIVRENIQLLQPQANKKRIRLKYDYQNIAEAYADMDMTRLVIRNLVSNAIKFSKFDDSISVKIMTKDRYVAVSVKDNGVGISEEKLPHLFSNMNYSTLGTANEKGNGLGLMLCKDFVEKNGGKIWVESQENKGCTFIFTIPQYHN